jgi:hypothetical protein
VRLQAVSIGPMLDHEAVVTGVVHGSFPHAINWVIGDDLWTLMSVGRSDLPFSIRVAAETLADFRIRKGDRVSARGGFLAVGGQTVIIDFRAAPQWRVPRPRKVTPGISQRLAIVEHAAAAKAWQESAITARDVSAALAHDPGTLADRVARVIGRGPGLTPAGDDVLAGILAVLALPQSDCHIHAARDTLTRLVRPLLPMTTSLSGYLLQQATNGQFSKAVHDLLFALVEAPSVADLMRAIGNLLAIGATSGADVCMGVVAAADRCLAMNVFKEAA